MIIAKLKRRIFSGPAGRGLTATEVLLALALGVFVLGMTVTFFVRQNSLLRNENDQTLVRAKARYAIKLIAREIRMAGYGLPPGQAVSGYAESVGQPITATGPLDSLPGSAASIGFRINRENVRTFLDFSSTAMISGTVLPVVDGSGFKSGDRIAIYNPGNKDTWDETLPTVASASTGSLTLQAALVHSYPSDPAARAIQVAKFSEVEIRIDNNGNIVKSVDGADSILISGAAIGPDPGLYFDFHAAPSPRLVDRIGIRLKVMDPENSGAAIDIKTDVRLRNTSS